jgi:hypothetical protein
MSDSAKQQKRLYILWLRFVVFISQLILIILRVGRRIRTGSISDQLHDELIKIAEIKQSEIQSQTIEQKRKAIASAKQVFHQFILQGEQQAKCFTLAVLVVIFVGIIMTLW